MSCYCILENQQLCFLPVYSEPTQTSVTRIYVIVLVFCLTFTPCHPYFNLIWEMPSRAMGRIKCWTFTTEGEKFGSNQTVIPSQKAISFSGLRTNSWQLIPCPNLYIHRPQPLIPKVSSGIALGWSNVVAFFQIAWSLIFYLAFLEFIYFSLQAIQLFVPAILSNLQLITSTLDFPVVLAAVLRHSRLGSAFVPKSTS